MEQIERTTRENKSQHGLDFLPLNLDNVILIYAERGHTDYCHD